MCDTYVCDELRAKPVRPGVPTFKGKTSPKRHCGIESLARVRNHQKRWGLLRPTPLKRYELALLGTDHQRVKSSDTRERVDHPDHDRTGSNWPETTGVRETITSVRNGQSMSMRRCSPSIRKHPLTPCYISNLKLLARLFNNLTSSGRLSLGSESAGRRSLTSFLRPKVNEFRTHTAFQSMRFHAKERHKHVQTSLLPRAVKSSTLPLCALLCVT